jgi:ATP-dependent Clp protease protease subunit
VRERLFDQRVVFVTGTLDHQASGQAAMELMTLDASGDDPILLRLECGEGDLDAALSLMEVIELVGVPVRVSAFGLVGGPALGVLAVGHHRAATPHTRFALVQPTANFSGPAREVEQWAEQQRERWQLFCARLAAATGRDLEAVAADFDRRRHLGATEALDYGLVDAISGPDSRGSGPRPRPLGFGPVP